MSIQTPYALCGQALVHISERISKDRKYSCPVCESAVWRKKGNNIAHHFYHLEKQDCPATEETLLHATAKHYILSRNDIKIQFPKRFFEMFPSFFDLLESRLGINYSSLPLNKILEHYYCENITGEAEKSVGPYIADIRFRNTIEDNCVFVIEILVTHEIEESKRVYLLENQIPFIEVRPHMNKSKIEFHVESANIPEYLQETHIQLEEELYNLLFTNFKQDILEDLKLQLTDSHKVKLEKQIAIDDLRDSVQSLNLRDYINREIYTKMHSIPATAYATGKSIKLEPVRKNSIRISGNSLKVNEKFVNYESRILADLLYKLTNKEVDLHAFVEQSNKSAKQVVTGFNFVLPSEQFIGKTMKETLIKMTHLLEEGEKSNLDDSNNFPF